MSSESTCGTAAAAGCPAGAPSQTDPRHADLGDAVTESLISIRLQLQTVLPAVDALGSRRLRAAIHNLDALIDTVREVGVVAAHGPAHDVDSPGHASPPDRVRASCHGNDTADIHALIEEAQRLRGQLHRVSVALALTEEFAADTLERMAADGGPHAQSRRVWARHAREGARACRELDARLDEPLPRNLLRG